MVRFTWATVIPSLPAAELLHPALAFLTSSTRMGRDVLLLVNILCKIGAVSGKDSVSKIDLYRLSMLAREG